MLLFKSVASDVIAVYNSHMVQLVFIMHMYDVEDWGETGERASR